MCDYNRIVEELNTAASFSPQKWAVIDLREIRRGSGIRNIAVKNIQPKIDDKGMFMTIFFFRRPFNHNVSASARYINEVHILRLVINIF